MKDSAKNLMNKQPLIISGPCSAESREQVLETARALQKTGKVDIFRSGIWKPRTSPSSFEGVGEKGLDWLSSASEETGLPTIIEVATPRHVKLALEHNVDLVWIGARTAVSPFAVQQIADQLKGKDVPVFIKNPINPEVKLWNGAVERIEGAGIEDIGLLHRGFSTLKETKYRYAPVWEKALEMKNQHPNKPFLVDPSHIGGKRKLIEQILQKALKEGYDGAMIESHINPPEALSDADQQLTPQQLDKILSKVL